MIAALVALGASEAGAWGKTAHLLSHERASEVLPESPLRRFVKKHEKTLLEKGRAIECPPREAKREADHRIDTDASPKVIDRVKTWGEVVGALGEKPAYERGRLLWAFAEALERASAELRGHDLARTQDALVQLAHFAADLHAPGAVTIESRQEKDDHGGLAALVHEGLIAANAREVRQAVVGPNPTAKHEGIFRRVDDPIEWAWVRVQDSHRAWKELVVADPGKKFKGREKELWKRMGSRICGRLAASASTIAQAWHAAWLRAGEPAIDDPKWFVKAPVEAPAPEVPDEPAPVASPTETPPEKPPEPPPPPVKKGPPSAGLVRANELARRLGIVFLEDDSQPGASIESVAKGSAAADAGLGKGDVIIDADGKPIHDAGDMVLPLTGKQPGEVFVLSVLRDGRPSVLRLKVPR